MLVHKACSMGRLRDTKDLVGVSSVFVFKVSTKIA